MIDGETLVPKLCRPKNYNLTTLEREGASWVVAFGPGARSDCYLEEALVLRLTTATFAVPLTWGRAGAERNETC